MVGKRKGLPPEKQIELLERVARKMAAEGLLDPAGVDDAVDRAMRPAAEVVPRGSGA